MISRDASGEIMQTVNVPTRETSVIRRTFSCPCLCWLFAFVMCFGLLHGQSRASAEGEEYGKVALPFLKQHCYTCHGPEKQKSQIRYDQLTGYRNEDQHLWTMVHEMLSTGEMPPSDRPQPTAAEKKIILSWIEKQAALARKSLGSGNTRRLNRRELSASLQDLTGLSIHYADAMAGDGKVDGFDTGAEGLQDAADSVVHLMQITRRVVDGIRFIDPAPGFLFKADFQNSKDPRKELDNWKKDGASLKGSGIGKAHFGLLLEPKWVGDRGGVSVYLPVRPDRKGIVRLKVVASVMKPSPGVPDPLLWIEVGGKDIDYVQISAPYDKPVELIYEVQIDDVAIETRGVHVSINPRVEIPYGVAGFENEVRSKPDEVIPGGPSLFRPAFDRKTVPLEKHPIPYVVLHRMEVDANHVAAWPPASWNSGIDSISDDPKIARQLLSIWIDRAWRRPTTAAEQERFHELYAILRMQGMSFDESLRAAFQSVLLSGRFRYLTSTADPDPKAAQYAIASRLSYMLWGAPPDKQLLELAGAGKLRDPKVLDGQVDRLLSDPRSEAFHRPFVEQWLELGQPITLVMNHMSQQDFRFGRHLKASMKEETIAYIAQLFTENRPAVEVIQSDWTMMNDALAIHYGYTGIEGTAMRKVQIRKDDPRGGGILGHAGIQSMLTWMGENWVIYRGAWTLRHVLDDPPPPTPLEVPELIPSEKENQGKSFRELLKQHQADENCSVCHRKMDPMGFAFQNFDLAGRWRTQEFERYVRNELDGKIEWYGTGKSRPVDAVGALPRGEKFETFEECRQLMAKHYQPDLVRGILKRLMLYGTGRKPDVNDMALIKGMMSELAPKGYPMRDLVKAVVRSPSFMDQ